MTQAITARRAFVIGAASLPALGALTTPSLASSVDPVVQMVNDHAAALARWRAAVEEPGGGNFDTPECERWQAEMDRLRPLIVATPAASPEGLLAQLAFVRAEYGDGWLDAVGPTADNVPLALLDTLATGIRRIAQ